MLYYTVRLKQLIQLQRIGYICKFVYHARILMGNRGSEPPSPQLKNHKKTGFLSNTGPDPLKNHKATQPAFKVWPSSVCQQNAILMFYWCLMAVAIDPHFVVFGTSLLSSEKKLYQSWTPSGKAIWIRACRGERLAFIYPDDI